MGPAAAGVGTRNVAETRVFQMARKLLSPKGMNPGIGILWICIGVAAGWFATKIIGPSARASALANIGIGVVAALVAGYITQHLIGANLGYAGVIVGLGGALLGSCLLIGVWQLLSPRHA